MKQDKDPFGKARARTWSRCGADLRADTKYLRESWQSEEIAEGVDPRGWRARVVRRVGTTVVGTIMCDSAEMADFVVRIHRAQREATDRFGIGTEVTT